MVEVCRWGSRAKADAPESFSLETGVLCSILGIASPGCKAADSILPSLFPLINLPGKVGKAIREVYLVVSSLPDEFVPTADFCVHPPIFPTSVPNWLDVVGAFSGLWPDALVGKMAEVYAYERWFQYCECVPRPPIDQPPPPSPQPPIVIPLPPEGECNPAFNRIRDYYQNFLEVGESEIAAYFANNPEIEVYEDSIWNEQKLTETGTWRHPGDFPEFYEIPHPPEEAPDCICEYRVLTARSFIARPSPGAPIGIQQNLPSSFRWRERCRVLPPEPEPLPPEDFPDDFIPPLCELVPDLPGCEECPPGTCETESVSVSIEVPLPEALSQFAATLWKCGDEQTPDCAAALQSLQGIIDQMSNFSCDDFSGFLSAKGGEIQGVKDGYPGCDVEIDERVDGQWPLLCNPVSAECMLAKQAVPSMVGALGLSIYCDRWDDYSSDVSSVRNSLTLQYPGCETEVESALREYFDNSCYG